MTRIFNRWTQIGMDLAVLSAAFWAAFFLRFEGVPPATMFTRLVTLWPYAVLLQYAVLSAFRVPRYAWRHVGLREVTRIFTATALTSSVFLALRILSDRAATAFPPAEHVLIPIGVILIDLALAFLGIAGIRALRRVIAERAQSRRHRPAGGRARRTLLVGAGEAGRTVARELAQRPDLGVKAVGFVDDDPAKVGLDIHGLTVLGSPFELGDIVRRTGATQALLTIATGAGRDIRRISELCRDAGLTTKIIPGMSEIVGGTVNLSRIREVDVEDLLGREPVTLDEDAIAGELEGRKVLVSGAGGSIGAELCRQVCRFQPASLLLFERSENALFEIHRELAEACPGVPVQPLIGDVCDGDRVDAVFAAERPEVVFHAAAHKHVPMMESNAAEAIKNNVGGTRIFADAADRHGVDAFVMISTDKAVNPTSVMGASKRVAEMYAQALSTKSATRFVTVRFGNVLGSAGSVIPIFRRQLARGGPIKVTHPDMRRYFMTIPEACQLVLQAGAMGTGAEIFVLDMGRPVKIVDLARDVIELSGLVPDEDIRIEFSGVRPGEKLFEELSVTEENATTTRHPKIFIGKGRPPRLGEVRGALERLRRCADGGDPDTIRAGLRAVVPEYRPEANDGANAHESNPAPAPAPVWAARPKTA